ncbi:hypothetical protein [Arsenophonus nasoniae]|nr:hypothetical protein [Arsenophonus nasoniae]
MGYVSKNTLYRYIKKSRLAGEISLASSSGQILSLWQGRTEA